MSNFLLVYTQRWVYSKIFTLCRSLLSERDSEEDSLFNKLHRHTSLTKESDTDEPRFHSMHRLRWELIFSSFFILHAVKISTTCKFASLKSWIYMICLLCRSTRPVKKINQDPSADSASSGEDDDEDGFEILTAENLFSTLLQRVWRCFFKCFFFQIFFFSMDLVLMDIFYFSSHFYSYLQFKVRALTNRINVNNETTSGFPSSRFMSNLRQGHSPFWHHDPFGRWVFFLLAKIYLLNFLPLGFLKFYFIILMAFLFAEQLTKTNNHFSVPLTHLTKVTHIGVKQLKPK